MAFLLIVTIIIGCYLGLIYFIENRKRYWAKRGVPFEPMDIPFVTKTKVKRAGFLAMKDNYTFHKRLGRKYFGSFSFLKPVFQVADPDLVRNVLTKDFNNFMDRGMYYDEKHDPMSGQLFNLEGQKWKNLRAKLTPTFTSGKMKMMFQTLLDCGMPMVDRLEVLYNRKDAIEIKEIVACFTTDVIGSCAFGLECNSFKSETEVAPFRAAGKNFFGMNKLRFIRIMLIQFFPKFCKMIHLPMFEKSLTNFYFDVVKDTVKFREENNISRNDFMQLLIELKNNKDMLGGLNIGEIAAQAFIFFLAGFETSSTLMHFAFYELTQYPEIQDKLREEILQTMKENDGKLTYDSVMGMKYMGQVLDETLRKYPPVPTLLRQCVIDYKLPNSDFTLEAGTKVEIPVYALQHDPEFYPDPDKFDPERFTEENKAKRHPYVYIPFGEGPRICIGLRFGLMQSRVGLALILSRYRVKLHSKTITPIGISPTAFLMSSNNTIWLELEKL
ncbi:cytochrome p450 [Holotrichia oblita]|uniref:Cytochrome p450 n=1 Tax=Holotrichia oblita TaxID=644536 RepID=A0ACB9SHK3_HOLOL|nr:cytochrome p450 [Holotrichia oblita]